MVPEHLVTYFVVGAVAMVPLVYVAVGSFAADEPSLGMRSVILAYLIWGAWFVNSEMGRRVSLNVMVPVIMVAFACTFFMACAAVNKRQQGGIMGMVFSLASLMVFYMFVAQGHRNFG